MADSSSDDDLRLGELYRRKKHKKKNKAKLKTVSTSGYNSNVHGNVRPGCDIGQGRPRRSCTAQTNLQMSEVLRKDMESDKEAWGGILEPDDRFDGDDDDDHKSVKDTDDDDVNLMCSRRSRPSKSTTVSSSLKTTGLSNTYDDDDHKSVKDTDDDDVNLKPGQGIESKKRVSNNSKAGFLSEITGCHV